MYLEKSVNGDRDYKTYPNIRASNARRGWEMTDTIAACRIKQNGKGRDAHDSPGRSGKTKDAPQSPSKMRHLLGVELLVVMQVPRKKRIKPPVVKIPSCGQYACQCRVGQTTRKGIRKQVGFIDGSDARGSWRRSTTVPDGQYCNRLASQAWGKGIPREVYHWLKMSLRSRGSGETDAYGMLMTDYRWAPAGKWGEETTARFAS